VFWKVSNPSIGSVTCSLETDKSDISIYQIPSVSRSVMQVLSLREETKEVPVLCPIVRVLRLLALMSICSFEMSPVFEATLICWIFKA